MVSFIDNRNEKEEIAKGILNNLEDWFGVPKNTNKFYKSLGFKEFACFPTLWDKYNPCQVYIMSII